MSLERISVGFFYYLGLCYFFLRRLAFKVPMFKSQQFNSNSFWQAISRYPTTRKFKPLFGENDSECLFSIQNYKSLVKVDILPKGAELGLGALFKYFLLSMIGDEAGARNESFNLMGVDIHNWSASTFLKFLNICVANTENRVVSFVNADCLNKQLKDNLYRSALCASDLRLPDGIGVRIGAKVVGGGLRENLNGTDLFLKIVKNGILKGHRLYFLGGEQGVALKAKMLIEKNYPGVKIVGAHHGYLNSESTEEIIKEINSKHVDILFVGMGVPNQEIWIQENKVRLNVNMALGVGGLFDYYSGKTKRAPIWMRELALEWLFRFLQEPKRLFGRYVVGIPLFFFNLGKWWNNCRKDNVEHRIVSLSTNMKPIWINRISNHCLLKSKSIKKALKRFLDIFLIVLASPIVIPIFMAIALAIYLNDRGPIFFTQERVGKEGRRFNFYKFRSMVRNAESLKTDLMKENESSDGVTFKMKDDPRITKVGKILRRTSLDELPQLINVLLGNMSLVGPRPPVPGEVALYSPEDWKRLDCTPGITCIWQVSGRSNIPFKKQVKLDQEYIVKQSLLEDFKLLFKTISAVVSGDGAY